jgi:hypothetical protein
VIGRACGTCKRGRKCTEVLVGKSEGKRPTLKALAQVRGQY